MRACNGRRTSRVSMIRSSFLAAFCLTALLAPSSAGAGATRVHPADPTPTPHHFGMKRYRGGFNQASSPICQTPRLHYYDGPIIQSPVIVPVFWSSHVNAQLTAPTTGIAQFFADVTQSSYWSWLKEYDTAGLSSGSNQAVLGGTATAGVTLTPANCASTGICTVNDTQIQNELANQINAGVLPAPTLDCTGNSQTIYMIEFPPNVKVVGPQGAGNSCTDFCAYHSTGTYNGNPLLYAALMDEFTGACAQGCGNDATAMENSTDTASHELVEAVTDPDIGLVPSGNMQAPGGWYDPNNQCGEVADICADGSVGATITVSGRSWVVQQVWSNKQNRCASSGSTPAVCMGSNTTNCRPCTCGDDDGACSTTCNLATGTCACTALTACPTSDVCGSVSDGCGGTVSCGTCGANEVCSNNVCEPAPPTSSTSGSSSSDATSGSDGSTSGSGASGTGSTNSGSTTRGTAGSSSGTSGHSATGTTGTAQGGSTGNTKDDKGGGCGCGASGSSPLAIIGLVLGLGLLRRKRAASDRR